MKFFKKMIAQHWQVCMLLPKHWTTSPTPQLFVKFIHWTTYFQVIFSASLLAEKKALVFISLTMGFNCQLENTCVTLHYGINVLAFERSFQLHSLVMTSHLTVPIILPFFCSFLDHNFSICSAIYLASIFLDSTPKGRVEIFFVSRNNNMQ